MKRVVVVGSGGAGKTWLARELAARLGLPMTTLDGVYYNEAWEPLPHTEFVRIQRELVTQPAWVIDGNYANSLAVRLAAADTVVVLDRAPLVCLSQLAVRWLRHGRGQFPVAGVYNRITWDFLRYVLKYRATMLPRVYELVRQHAPEGAEVHTLRSRADVSSFLQKVFQG